MLDKIKSEQWNKNWSGTWGPAFVSLYFLYTDSLKPYIGRNLDNNLLICEPGLSSNYIAKRTLDKYGKYTASLVIGDELIVSKWEKDTLATTKNIFKILKQLEIEKHLNLANLLKLKQAFYEHVPPHFTIKKMIDYLPERLQDKLTPSLIKVRVETEHLFNAVDEGLKRYVQMITRETKGKYELINLLTINEIVDYLKNKKLPKEKELKERAKGFAFFCFGDHQNIIVGSEYIKLQKYLSSFSGDEIKGSPAYKGLAVGIARIIHNPFKVKNFNEGDILITGMTRPEFLSLMKKAGAFVTDAGGLLSHAAIVARELKKPCILATEHGSKIIKDGDLIEVDANKGIIRILKRA
jgi:phosphohistidine swiveling domain-containing protein